MPIIHAEAAKFTATSDHATVTFESGGDTITVHLPHHIAVMFTAEVKRESWPLSCAPDGELIDIKDIRRQRRLWRQEAEDHRLDKVAHDLWGKGK